MIQSSMTRRSALKTLGGMAGAAAVMSFPNVIRARQTPHEIVHWSTLTASDGEVWQRMIDAFNEAHASDGIQIRLEVVPSDQYGAKLLSSAAVGQAPDFGWGAAGTRLDWISQGVVQPLDDIFTSIAFDLSDFTPASLEACRYTKAEGKLYGMPMDVLSLQVLVNLDHAAEAGLEISQPPETGDELLEWAERMTVRDGDTVTRSGWLMTGSGFQPSVVWGTVAQQMGFRRASDDLAQAAVNPEAGVAAAQWILDLFDTHKVASRDVADRYKAFGTGEASMFYTGPWTLTGYLQQGMNLGAFLYPRIGDERATYRNIWGLEMYTQPDSSRYEFTARALQWLSDNSFLWTTEGRGVTPRVSILERADYKTAGHPWEVRAPFVEGLDFATVAQVPVRASTDFEVYTATDLVAQTMDPVWAKEASAEDAISTLAMQWQADLDAG
jgi:ABC-type glycerol-3-phosphate transport system substrate-binding protein